MKLLKNRKTRASHSRGGGTGWRTGFSLIEILIVIAIVVILGLILLTVFTKTWKLIQSWRSDAGQPSQHVATAVL